MMMHAENGDEAGAVVGAAAESKNVLIIGSELILSRVVRTHFTSRSWSLWFAKDLNEGWILLHDRKFRLVMADCRLPQELSTDLYYEFKKLCPNFLWMTEAKNVVAIAQENEIEQFILKPFHRKQFQEVMSQLS